MSLPRVHRDVRELIRNGYTQTSRRFRRLAKLPDGMSGIEAMQTVDPTWIKERMSRLEADAAELFCRVHSAEKIELTDVEFAIYLQLRRYNGRDDE